LARRNSAAGRDDVRSSKLAQADNALMFSSDRRCPLDLRSGRANSTATSAIG